MNDLIASPRSWTARLCAAGVTLGCLLSTSCSPAGDPAVPNATAGSANGRTQAAAPGRTVPVPVPFPLTFPVPVPVGQLDQEKAYVNTALQLADFHAYAVLARDERTGDIGIALVSNTPAAGAVLAAARGGVGAVLLGGAPALAWKREGLDLLAAGKPAREVVAELVKSPEDDDAARQLAVMDGEGRSFHFQGHKLAGGPERTMALSRPNFMAIVCNTGRYRPIAEAMRTSFEATADLSLAERLLLALRAGWTVEKLSESDETMFQDRPAASAALLVTRPRGGYDARSDQMIDLRVDLSDDPIPRLIQTYYAWCSAVLVPRLPSIIRLHETGSPALEIDNGWLRRARGKLPIGER